MLRAGSESLPWLLFQCRCIRTAHGIRPGLDPQAGRGYGQPQPGQQAQGQSASGTWQDQVRGNPAAEYAALMQSRTADGTGGGVQGHVQFAGMQQMGMNQAMGEQGFGGGMMHGGCAPRGDPAAAYAAMMQAQTAPAQPPAMQPQFGAPAAGAGWQGATIYQVLPAACEVPGRLRMCAVPSSGRQEVAKDGRCPGEAGKLEG